MVPAVAETDAMEASRLALSNARVVVRTGAPLLVNTVWPRRFEFGR